MNDSVFRETQNRATIAGAAHFDDFVAHSIDLEISNGIPPGAVMAFDSTVCPTGWEAMSELSGRVIVGTGTLGSNTYTRGSQGGTASLTLTKNQMPAHSHKLGMQFSRCDDPPFQDFGSDQSGMSLLPELYGGGRWHSSTIRSGNPEKCRYTLEFPEGRVRDSGSGQSIDNRVPYHALLYCRKQ